jgi:hypothetical protein
LLRNGRSVVLIPRGASDFPSLKVFRQVTGSTQPPFLFSWYPGYFPGVKRLGREVDIYSCPSGAEVKNGWSCTAICACMAWAGVTCYCNNSNVILLLLIIIIGTTETISKSLRQYLCNIADSTASRALIKQPYWALHRYCGKY